MIFMDIETGPLPAKKREFMKPTHEDVKYGRTKDPEKQQAQLQKAIDEWETGEGAALNAVTGQTLLIGYAIEMDGPYISLFDDKSEAELIRSFWELVDRPVDICGFNSNRFDIPFLVRRSAILGVEIPKWIIIDLVQYKSRQLVDLCEIWKFYSRSVDATNKGNLAQLCGTFGIPVKTAPFGGADFHIYWQLKDEGSRAEGRDVCIEYNKEDVAACQKLYKAWKKTGLLC